MAESASGAAIVPRPAVAFRTEPQEYLPGLLIVVRVHAGVLGRRADVAQAALERARGPDRGSAGRLERQVDNSERQGGRLEPGQAEQAVLLPANPLTSTRRLPHIGEGL